MLVPEQKLLRNFLVWHTQSEQPNSYEMLVPEQKLLRNFLVWHTRSQEPRRRQISSVGTL